MQLYLLYSEHPRSRCNGLTNDQPLCFLSRFHGLMKVLSKAPAARCPGDPGALSPLRWVLGPVLGHGWIWEMKGHWMKATEN